MSEFVIPRRVLCEFFIDHGTKSEDIQKYLEEHHHLSSEKSEFIVKRIQKGLITAFNDRWTKSSRTKERFFSKNTSWLDGEFKVQFEEAPMDNTPTTSGERGRPPKSYEDLSEKSKKRKNMELVQEYGLEYIHNAYVQGLRSEGEFEEATVVSMMRNCDRNEKRIMKEKILHESRNATYFTVDEALSIFADLDLSKSQYGLLRANLINKNFDILPSYHILTNAKKLCYPPPSSIQITDTSAKVNLQDLLDHTSARILKIENVYNPARKSLKLFTKWGCDGSSGQSEYKQVLTGESDLVSDANLFIASLVPIKLTDTETNEVIWQNPACSSIRYCRPILMELAKETPEKTRSVVGDIRGQINNLQTSKIHKEEHVIEITHDLFLTMVDGKVTQVLTDTSSGAVCTVCGAKPSEMNNLEKIVSKPDNINAYEYGLSTLHAWIRCMELILHISYNLSFQKWAARTPEDKKSKEDKKKLVQSLFRSRMGLHVDKPRQGSGNSNDGNTARRFFENYHCAAEITGIDVELIKRFYVILQTLASGIAVNPEKFGEYTRATAQLYVTKYMWYNMPSSVHKILIHGESIIRHFAVLPIGNLSEDAQESRNKDYKKFRLNHARKCSRSATNQDVFHGLLFTSDPYISSIRKPSVTISKELLDEAKTLLDI